MPINLSLMIVPCALASCSGFDAKNTDRCSSLTDAEVISYIQEVYNSEERDAPIWQERNLNEMSLVSVKEGGVKAVRAWITYQSEDGRQLVAILYADCEVGWTY